MRLAPLGVLLDGVTLRCWPEALGKPGDLEVRMACAVAIRGRVGDCGVTKRSGMIPTALHGEDSGPRLARGLLV